MRLFLLFILILVSGHAVCAQEIQYQTRENIHYYSTSMNQSDPYINERCVLDIYFPENVKGYPTVVWFHGGGLTGGQKEIPEALKEKGICVVAVNYRLYPRVKAPVYIEDAAAAISWVFNNINSLNGDSTLIFISGHSAGGYLTSMVGLDKSWLLKYNIDANNIAGLIPFSGHTITHFTVRDERGIPGTQPIVDSLAPLFHVRPDAPPLLLITGDRELEMLGRYEENAYLMRMMKVAGHKETVLYELQGYGHNMAYPAFPLLLKEVQRITEIKKQAWELHGDLKTEGHFLVYEDGTPFFYLGDTNWEFLMQARREDARKLIENRSQKGFTVMQAVITGIYIKQEGQEGGDEILKGNVYGDQPFIDADVTRPLITPGNNPEDPEQYDYWDHLDFIIKTAAENGIYIGLLPCWHVLYDLKFVNKDNAREYGRWLGERYRNTPNIIWINGGDTWGHTGDGKEMFNEWAAGIRESDGDRHLMTFHPRGGNYSSRWFHEEGWLDFNMIQSGHAMRDNPNYLKISEDYQRIPVKPCMDGEPRYEDHSVNWNPANGWYKPFDVRQAAYWSLFAGSHGHTYGVRGVWQMYEPGRAKRGPLNYYWYEAMDLPGGADMQHVKDLMLSRPFLSRVPDQSLVVDSYEEADHIQSTRGDGYAFFYVPTGRTFRARLDKISAADSIHAWWYSPRDGLCYNGVELTIREQAFDTIRAPFDPVAEFDPPGEPLRGNDWVLVLDDASRGFPVPGHLLPGNK